MWQGCQAQDKKSQAQLYNFFSKKMFVVCLRYAQTTLEAEDILQNGFIKVFTKHHLFDGKGSLEGWIKRIMVNTAIESYRKSKEKITDSIDEYHENTIHSHFPSDTTSYQDLLKLIKELPLGYRTVFNLYAIEGYSHKEIAEMLNISEGSSKSQLSRARQVLQHKLIKENTL
ncbi:RNA polymerase sigma factor [Sphingobacterium bovistauri]|uniref:RNA polymerase sigma factor n=1 Tax=Sphingobacterium bovistauri TaxID=2781959 RepID=A0ABS7Z7R1_9SPHI|nr:RNA polymerase sigma factor [Sphingobacterium bovistauri]MCA5006033.1 RNA polymerase sigma factor [Sphingobacterium bovistauri]